MSTHRASEVTLTRLTGAAEPTQPLLATLHRIAGRMLLGDELAAAEAVQDALLRSRGALVCLESEGAQRSYLVTVVRHVCHDELRHRRRVIELAERSLPSPEPHASTGDRLVVADALG